MDRKRIQCLSNASQHVHIYLRPFTSYSEILVGNRNFFLAALHLTPPYGVAPGTIAVNVTRLERRFNACKTPRCIYPSIFNRYSELLVENCDILTPHLCLAATQGVTPSEFREDLDIHKTRMNGLSCGEESLTIYSAVLIQCQRVTDGRTDRQTYGRPAYIYYMLQHS